MSNPPIDMDAARRAVLARAMPLEAEDVPLADALGRHLSVDVLAGERVQGFDNSAMDGYAVRAADTMGAAAATPVSLVSAGESRAGHPADSAVMAGQAFLISTGAMLPDGADAVVRVEDTRREGDRVLVEVTAAPGLSIRRAGEDIAATDTVLQAGARLGPAELGVLASLGHACVRCHRRPRVAILTSGDELTEDSGPLAPGMVRNSNRHTLTALAVEAGADVVSVAWTPDEPEATRAALDIALVADVVLISGGVSVGEHDHVKGALDALGVEQDFWRVALRPGGPTWFGSRGATLVFGLPGNPVAVMVTFILFARPALLALGGGKPYALTTTATLTADAETLPGRASAVRCALQLTDTGWQATPAPRQGSHVLTSMTGAHCLALIPAAGGGLRAGSRVTVELLDGASIGPMGAIGG